MISDLSLNGVKTYAEDKGGINTSTHQSRHLRDLEALVNEMCQVRGGSLTSTVCSCHGNQLEGQNKTICSSHSISNYDKSTISLSELVDVLNSIPNCSCNAYAYKGCHCVSVCTCVCVECSCESDSPA